MGESNYSAEKGKGGVILRHDAEPTKPLRLHTRPRCTVCPRSSDPFYVVTYYIKMGHYFLDI